MCDVFMNVISKHVNLVFPVKLAKIKKSRANHIRWFDNELNSMRDTLQILNAIHSFK